MAVDIDSFLNKHFDEKEKLKEIKEEKIDLSFQKEVEDKLKNVQKKSNDSNFNFLEKAYNEVKKFDEDLNNKFLGIENKGNQILKEMGDR